MGKQGESCDVCQMIFTHLSELTSHKRIHTGEKPFSCGFCQKAFTQLDSLTMHKRSHTGEKPFNCGFCEKAFKTSSNLHTSAEPSLRYTTTINETEVRFKMYLRSIMRCDIPKMLI